MKARMIRWGKRALSFACSLFLLVVAVFVVSRLAPGDPLASYYGERVEKMSPQERAWAQARLGLDAPLAVQFSRWLAAALQGDFGISYKYKMPVLEVIAGRVGNTLLLGGLGFLLVFTLALPLGVLCAHQEGRWIDRAICRVGTVAGCIPEFWLALVLILVFSVGLGWLPSSGAASIGGPGGFGDRLRHLVLPLAVVVLGHLWYYAYMLRNRLCEETRAGYVYTAKAKGLSRTQVLARHCLPNCLPFYLGLMAISLPHILGGTYIVEMVFSYPGLGALCYESARYQDYNLLMLLCIFTGTVVMLCGGLAQAASRRADPRMDREEAGR